ncbi:MAG: hypothetical protein UT48_C0026G0004 [Parcubacteria group bacterium GW2011_GWE2_39_37]|nr:MAG: hypothetical protein UT48_C0026G0004 [Parcubacteria group bacterium GW2011_GWE2_39_37]
MKERKFLPPFRVIVGVTDEILEPEPVDSLIQAIRYAKGMNALYVLDANRAVVCPKERGGKKVCPEPPFLVVGESDVHPYDDFIEALKKCREIDGYILDAQSTKVYPPPPEKRQKTATPVSIPARIHGLYHGMV